MAVCVCATSHAAEDEEVKEVHPAQDEKHHAYFYREGFNALLCCFDDVAELQRQTDVTEVDQVKADDEQVID